MSSASFSHYLGLAITRRHKDGVTCRVPITPGLLNGAGFVHGGALSAIADDLAWHGIRQVAGVRMAMVTTELKVNYLRPVSGTHLTARCHVLKLGRLLMVTRIEIYDHQRRHAAHAVVTYARVPDDGQSSH